ncbi:MAG: copper amine oxidase N-terminal domain-containing protein [Peptococcaceae bacterium]|jgi:hypothetical protein|nr:copper amine oxidase N-terminal domain-containing protein [Peptococcaceae bacterium]
MRKRKALIAFVAVVTIIAFALPCLADQVEVYEREKLVKSVVFAIGVDEYWVDNKTPGIKMDAAPFIEKDRTFVPVRYLAYALGLTENDVAWDQEAKKVTLKGKATLEMWVGKPEIVSDGAPRTIDVAPVIKSEPSWRTYLPARFVAEGLGYEVDWDADTRTVICWPKGEPKPDVSAAVKDAVERREEMENPKLEHREVVPGHVDGIDVTDKGKMIESKGPSLADMPIGVWY